MRYDDQQLKVMALTVLSYRQTKPSRYQHFLRFMMIRTKMNERLIEFNIEKLANG